MMKAKYYLTDYSKLMEQFDIDKNKGIDPARISGTRKIKLWWKCSRGHSWQAMVSDRVRNHSDCPYCAHQKAIPGETDLLTKYPKIVSQLHPTKNGNIDPSQIMPGTHKKLWFHCDKCDQDYLMEVRSKVKGAGCPVCNNKILVKGLNDFETKHKDIALEWDTSKNNGKKPSDFFSSSKFKANWICPVGHKYVATIASRSNGHNCPVCASFNKTSFPEQAVYFYVKRAFPKAVNRYRDDFLNSMELDIFIPEIKVGIEYDGVAWHSSPRILEREKRKYEICREQGIILIRLRESEYDEPIGTCDYLYVVKKPDDLLFLSREIYKVLQHVLGIKDFPKKFLENVNSAPYLLTRENTPFYKTLIEDLDRLLLVDVDVKRDEREIKKYLTNFENCLAKYRQDLIDEWDFEANAPLTPYNVALKSNQIVWWKCKKCHKKWKVAISQRTSHDMTNCPYCARINNAKKRRDIVINRKGSIVETHPQVLEKWDYEMNELGPENYSYGSDFHAWWKCPKCSYRWQSAINKMCARNYICPCCTNKVCVSSINDIATLYPHLLLDFDYIKNSNIDLHNTQRRHIRIAWKCHNCGHEWYAFLDARARGAGCPKCAKLSMIGNNFAKGKKK